MHQGVGIEAQDLGLYRGIRRVGGERVDGGLQADLGAGLDLVGHVNLGRRIVAHDDHGQARNHALLRQRQRLLAALLAHLPGDGMSVYHFCNHAVFLKSFDCWTDKDFATARMLVVRTQTN
jgi:hypothetical protein